MLMFDLHVHSSYSSDAKGEIGEIIRVAKRRGLRGIAIVDHNEMRGALKAYEMAKGMNDFVVLRGMEVSSRDGHVIALAIDRPIERDLSVEETVERIRDLAGIAIAAHPYRFWSGLGEKNVTSVKFQGIEAHNGRSLQGQNMMAEALARRIDAAITGGSDAHLPEEVGRAVTVFQGDAESEESAVVQILQKQTRVAGSSRPLSASLSFVVRSVGLWIARGMKRI